MIHGENPSLSIQILCEQRGFALQKIAGSTGIGRLAAEVQSLMGVWAFPCNWGKGVSLDWGICCTHWDSVRDLV